MATIAEKYDIVDGVLKLNCEGGKYEIVEAATPEVVRRFHQIRIECHHGLGNIIDRLREAGFSAEFTGPRRIVGLGDQPRLMDLGYVRARRQAQP